MTWALPGGAAMDALVAQTGEVVTAGWENVERLGETGASGREWSA